MKPLLAAAMVLAATALGVGESGAQTDTSRPRLPSEQPHRSGRISARPSVTHQPACPDQSGIGAASPLGADFSHSVGDDSQTTPTPFTDAAKPGPCTSGGPGAVALSTFDGSGLSPTSGGLSPTTGFTTSGIGAESTASAPCNSVSSSSGVTGYLNSANSAATITPSVNNSSPASPPSLGLGRPAPATANTSPNTKGLGVTALGTSELGSTELGTTGLGSLPGQSASTLQTTTSPSTATQAETSCSGDLAAPPVNPGTVTAQSLSGGVPDPAQSTAARQPMLRSASAARQECRQCRCRAQRLRRCPE